VGEGLTLTAAHKKEGEMDALKYEVPDDGFKGGDVVMSKHHGRGVFRVRNYEGKIYREFVTDDKAQRVFLYAHDGRYFTSGEFEDKECMLALVERPPAEEESKEGVGRESGVV